MEMIMNGSRTGFTLVEILVVVVVLGILAAMVVPKFASASTDTRVVAAGEDILRLAQAFENFHSDKGYWPDSAAPGITPPELKQYFLKVESPFLKTCPINGTYVFSNNKNLKTVFIQIRPGQQSKSPSIVDAQALDAMIDDGVLNTGRFRSSLDGYAYRVN